MKGKAEAEQWLSALGYALDGRDARATLLAWAKPGWPRVMYDAQCSAPWRVENQQPTWDDPKAALKKHLSSQRAALEDEVNRINASLTKLDSMEAELVKL